MAGAGTAGGDGAAEGDHIPSESLVCSSETVPCREQGAWEAECPFPPPLSLTFLLAPPPSFRAGCPPGSRPC